VTYNGAKYNIPIIIWLLKTHPQQNPVVYVQPTPEMAINPSRYVDGSGRVYLPYLSEWKHPTSDLHTLVQVLSATFAEKIPVFTKVQQAPSAYAPPSSNYGRPPGYPPGGHNPTASYMPMPYPGQQQQPQQPYPPNTGGYMPQPPAMHQPAGMPQPPGMHQPAPGYGMPPQPYSSTPYPPNQPPGHYPVQMPAAPGSSYRQPPSYPPQGPNPYPPYHQPPGGMPVVNATPVMSAEEERRRIEEEERRRLEEEEKEKAKFKQAQLDSAVTAVEEKIKRQLESVLERAENEIKSLNDTQDKLNNNNHKLTTILREMDTKQQEVDKNVQLLKEKTVELESVIEYLESQPGEINVDDTVVPTNVLYNQILKLYAEENAIDDTIYYLGEALRRGVITHEVFLKHVRDLSRRQFIARATIMKARDKAGLPPHGVPG
jgi:ESCRT-I complex subunit TSG101